MKLKIGQVTIQVTDWSIGSKTLELAATVKWEGRELFINISKGPTNEWFARTSLTNDVVCDEENGDDCSGEIPF